MGSRSLNLKLRSMGDECPVSLNGIRSAVTVTGPISYFVCLLALVTDNYCYLRMQPTFTHPGEKTEKDSWPPVLNNI